MYCPNCGKQATGDQKYCRSCGLSLQAISQVLSGAPSPAQSDHALREMVERFQSLRQKLLRRGFIVVWIGILTAIFFSVVGDALRGFDSHVGHFIEELAGLGGMAILTGVGLMIYSRFLPKAPTAGQSTQPARLGQTSPQMNLPPQRHPESPASVTEHTTEILLEASNHEAPERAVRRTKG